MEETTLNNQEKAEIQELYLSRQKKHELERKKIQRTSNILSSLRLITFLAALGVLVWGSYSPHPYISYLSSPLLVLFIVWIALHLRAKRQIDFLGRLIYINKTALQRLDWGWTSFPGCGESYLQPDHPYTTDLNIFGRGSLFQYINSTGSFLGEQKLVEQLSRPGRVEEVGPRQEAVAELATRLDFRQYLQAEGMDPAFKSQDPEEVLTWAEGPLFWGRQWWNAVLFLPVAAALFFGIAFLGLLPFWVPAIILVVQVGVAFWGENIVRERFEETGKAVRLLKRYTGLLGWIEKESLQAPLLVELQNKIFGGDFPASRQVRVLAGIADRINLRYNNALIYFPLNIGLLWDLWTLKKLENWKKKWGQTVRQWFEVTGEIESLSSLAVLACDNPRWAYPSVSDGPPFIKARALGHPLIDPGERVENDLSLSGPGTVLLITGSNMSGKSTLLRTTGINLILAYAGAPVCAAEMDCAIMQVYSKMQVQDNLEQRISTFYAELKRMKQIIDAAREGEPLFFLLDEIFRGTNSRDRILATRTVIRQLKQMNTIGLVTTHDLELGTLEKEHPGAVFNYHFSDEIRGDQILFDYKLRPGISRTTNAVALMKMIGIDVTEEGENN